jgi:hypothetical protein
MKLLNLFLKDPLVRYGVWVNKRTVSPNSSVTKPRKKHSRGERFLIFNVSSSVCCQFGISRHTPGRYNPRTHIANQPLTSKTVFPSWRQRARDYIHIACKITALRFKQACPCSKRNLLTTKESLTLESMSTSGFTFADDPIRGKSWGVTNSLKPHHFSL